MSRGAGDARGLLSLVLVTGVLVSGCVRRSLTITTDPPGAHVFVNDALRGTSPVTYDFQWYGWHRVTIRKTGFERIEDRQRLRAPLYLWIPLDFIMELAPLTVRDTRTWAYVLEPKEELPTPQPPTAVENAAESNSPETP